MDSFSLLIHLTHDQGACFHYREPLGYQSEATFYEVKVFTKDSDDFLEFLYRIFSFFYIIWVLGLLSTSWGLRDPYKSPPKEIIFQH